MSHNRKMIYLAGFVFSLPIALMAYINSSYISTFIDEKSVGIIYALASIVSIFALLLVPKIFRKIGGSKFLFWIIALDSLSIFLFAFSKNALSAAILFISAFTFNILIYFTLDEILRIFSKESSIGTIRGSYLALSNFAWIIAQILLGTILGEFSFKMIYLVSFVLMII